MWKIRSLEAATTGCRVLVGEIDGLALDQFFLVSKSDHLGGVSYP